jgi:hypothetical protein
MTDIAKIPLLPAIVGSHAICPPDVWSNDISFMIYSYKIIPCLYVVPHDWRICPWAHPSERALRRCPRAFAYKAVSCINTRRGRPCARGNACKYSHNVTEYWLHPARYRTEMCSLGSRCDRRLCFFAHSDQELRSPA